MICAATFALSPLLRGTCRVLPSCSSFLRLRYAASCYCTINGKMKSRRKSDHLERTANDFRQEGRLLYTWGCCSWWILNMFKSWPSGTRRSIGTCSKICNTSSCSLDSHSGIYMCTLDSEVALRVGGNFFFDPQPADSPSNLVLIAGGVGINPLFSILLHAADLHRARANKGTGYKMGTTNLFYCAKNTHELLFRKHILGLTNAFPGKIACSFHVTQQSLPICEKFQPYTKEGRISGNDLEKCISQDTLWYVCGPPPMIQFIVKLLEKLGVAQKNVFFEKWW
ncbi:oxidoreductase NAD-binding domain-containing protein 1 isoform X2 [Sceloporus undulatus]|uniref:oxidoreductase NAD-binding domain-containing protein 1 isoform X2 n=1 Tax=Sceloporus undulatus TaxID=8520 RepID=UPI001C4B98BC|nr:oxidoreductase NAD-binding domain-containing protein 1 isoform X2 [Sceloporus undulatus]